MHKEQQGSDKDASGNKTFSRQIWNPCLAINWVRNTDWNICLYISKCHQNTKSIHKTQNPHSEVLTRTASTLPAPRAAHYGGGKRKATMLLKKKNREGICCCFGFSHNTNARQAPLITWHSRSNWRRLWDSKGDAEVSYQSSLFPLAVQEGYLK